VLTTDLVKVRRRQGRIVPLWLKGRQAAVWEPIAEALIDVFSRCEGMTRSQLGEAVEAVIADAGDKVRADGLVKLLEDGCEIDASVGSSAESVREEVFRAAAAQRRGLGIRDDFDREGVVAACAARLGRSAEEVERSLFEDLPGAQVIRGWKKTSATSLLQRYDLALAQGVLLRAVHVCIELEPASGPRLRDVFRMIKFCRLMHTVREREGGGWVVELDGPMSLFEATQRYGVQLAMFLPTLVAGDGWKLRAEVLWGRDRQRLQFELSDGEGLVSTRSAPSEPEEVEALVRGFGRLDTGWEVRQEARVFHLKGRGVFVPDLVFEHGATGQRVYLEVFGYWSREAVFKRLELLEAGFGHKVLLAVSRRLRVSEGAAEEGFPGKILVFTQSISAHAVRAALDTFTGVGE